MIKKTLLTGAALLAIATGVQGQIQKQVDVTRAYEPSVANFQKLNLSPNLTDTTSLRPEFTYNITPHPLSYTFGTSPIRPTSFNTVDSRQLYPFYLKVGSGAPLQSVLDFYATKAYNRGNLGASVNHYGQWADIENDMQVKEPSTLTFNSANVWGDLRVTRSLILGANVGYDYNVANRYGYYTPSTDIAMPVTLPDWFDPDDQKQRFSTFHGGVTFGTDFVDMDRFNFQVAADIADMGDKFDFGQTDYTVGLTLGKNFEYFGLLADASYTGVDGRMPDLTPLPEVLWAEPFGSTLWCAGASVSYDNGNTRFRLGFDFHIEDNSIEENKHTHFFPLFEFEKEFADGRLIPFLTVDEDMIFNDYRRLAGRNPYIYQGVNGANTHEYNGRVGLKGRLSPSFRYKVFGGYSDIHEMAGYYNVEIPLPSPGVLDNAFALYQGDAKLWTAGIELEANVMNAVQLWGKAQYFNYKLKDDVFLFDKPLDRPDFTVEVGAHYNYREKLYLGLRGNLIGSRYTLALHEGNPVAESGKTGQVFDLGFNADYFITRQVGVFVEVNNILNQKLYPFNHYPGLGVNFMAGVKLSF